MGRQHHKYNTNNMQHLPVALLLAFCALFTGVLAQDAVPVDSDACYIRIDAFPGNTSCGGEKYCAYARVNETQCGSLRLGSTSYSTKANCTAHTFALYESADCSSMPPPSSATMPASVS